ncbi:Lrp/AsnC family transcriptional regulator [Fertoeibacter niger]|uniref:Lrp/AsnC family transcriptional regulator n=1 Tax=Fertoeibacter niger TaxID=2656921 RepID=UPI001F4CAE27|nr:Lrp/AsnC family transcriptional regulator [Fertoeibacter niger]
MQKLEAARVITGHDALVDPASIGLGLTVVVEIEAAGHTPEWRSAFAAVVSDYPEIVEVHCMAGEVDYLIKVAVSGMAAYGAFYLDLTQRLPCRNVA